MNCFLKCLFGLLLHVEEYLFCCMSLLFDAGLAVDQAGF